MSMRNAMVKLKDRATGGSLGCRLLLLLAFALCLLPFVLAQPESTESPLAPQPATDWKQALPPYQFNFPADHASHPAYKTEWWYYTGNLAAQDGRRFGYQLTFFRIGVEQAPQNTSRWAVRDLYAAHLAVTEVRGQRFHFSDKLNRAGIGWAGAATAAYRVWNEDWEARQDASGQHLLRAYEPAFGLELQLDEGKAPVAHGAQGVSQKGAQPGNASHYYSLTRMPTRGVLVLDSERIAVEGASWMDHEFGTSYLEPAQLGWDWFSLQLDDGTELMLYRFRREGGVPDPLSSGTAVDVAGRAVALKFSAFDLTPLREWRSASGASYPVEWRVQIASRELELIVRAVLDNQEMRTESSTGVNYWEGAIKASGTQRGRPITGRGYLEMTGYTGVAMGAIMQ